MSSKELNSMLLEKFPELKEKFDEETNWQEGLETGSFIVFEDVFMPFLEANVEANNNEMVERIYSFIESLCDIDDEYVQNILYVAILENISSYVNAELYSKHLKEKCMAIYNREYKKS